MTTIFYDHLIPWEKVDTYVRELDVTSDERLEIIELIEETVHTHMLIIILTHIPREKHEEFIEQFNASPSDAAHLEYLHRHSGKEIERKMQSAIEEVISDLLGM